MQLPLLPFSSLFACVAATRRSLYAHGICSKTGPVVPVVVVGGITVGGTGKTPICIALVKELRARGFNPGVLSRGYKCHCTKFPSQVPMDADPYIFGDEPCLIRRQSKAPVVIDPQRVRGADYLASLGVDVIITDDGLQHYALDREVEICVLDGSRMLGNGHLLPAGPLREAKWRLKTVDSVVVSGAVAHLGYNPMVLKHSSITPLNDDLSETLDSKSEVCAFSGIGNPERFYTSLEDCGFNIKNKVDVGDHNKIPFEKLQKLCEQMPVIMTAKDAIKYQAEAKQHNLSNVFVFNVTASLSKQFFDGIANSIRQSAFKVSQRRKEREARGYKLTLIEPIDSPHDKEALLEPTTAAADALGIASSTTEAVAPISPESEEAASKSTAPKKSLKAKTFGKSTDSISSVSEGSDIFGMKKPRDIYDPSALPSELKRRKD